MNGHHEGVVLTRREAREQRLRDTAGAYDPTALDAPPSGPLPAAPAHPAAPAAVTWASRPSASRPTFADDPSAPAEVATGNADTPGGEVEPRSETGTVRVVLVCTGNVIRSALIERALQQQFRLLDDERVEFASAGTRADVGAGMRPEAVEIARAYGFDHESFVSRQLDESILRGVDVVVVAEHKHKEAVLRRRPDLMRRTFTFRELVRILENDPPPAGADGGVDLADRWREVAAWADRRRAFSRPRDITTDDLPDPNGSGRRAFWEFESELIRGVVSIVSTVAGERR